MAVPLHAAADHLAFEHTAANSVVVPLRLPICLGVDVRGSIGDAQEPRVLVQDNGRSPIGSFQSDVPRGVRRLRLADAQQLAQPHRPAV